MITFKKTKSLADLLRELPIGETICIDYKQTKTSYVRRLVTALRKEGYGFRATEKGYVNQIGVTKLSNKK
jgi:hypothetical protein